MKPILLFVFIFWSICSHAKNGTANKKTSLSTYIINFKCQDTTLAYLMTLNLVYYKNKPVDSLLSMLPMNYISRNIHGMGNLKYARVLSVKYSGNIRVLIFVDDFTHMNPRSETLQWNINLFKQKNTGCIEIWNGSSFMSSTRCKQR